MAVDTDCRDTEHQLTAINASRRGMADVAAGLRTKRSSWRSPTISVTSLWTSVAKGSASSPATTLTEAGPGHTSQHADWPSGCTSDHGRRLAYEEGGPL
jgi:hypothetical protein